MKVRELIALLQQINPDLEATIMVEETDVSISHVQEDGHLGWCDEAWELWHFGPDKCAIMKSRPLRPGERYTWEYNG